MTYQPNNQEEFDALRKAVKITLTQEQINKLIHTGSLLSLNDCFQYADHLPEGTSIDDIENEMEVCEAYDNFYFECVRCSNPFAKCDISLKDFDETVCKDCEDE